MKNRLPSVRITSSVELGWKSVVIEPHRAKPGQRPQTAVGSYIVELASGQTVTKDERPVRMDRSTLLMGSKMSGMINVYPEGMIPAIRPATRTDLFGCALDPVLVQGVADELGIRGGVLRSEIGFRDETIETLLRLLEAEVGSRTSANPPYVAHLTFALTSRLLSRNFARSTDSTPRYSVSYLPLRRAVEKMESDLESDLDLVSLAALSGYSRNHFLRIFRSATGFTPHQYLIKLRIARAKTLLRNKQLRLIDVAIACGFSSHTNFSRVFRQHVGHTPSDYRRSV